MDMYKKSGVNLAEAQKLNRKLVRNSVDKNLSEFVGAVDTEGVRIYNCCDGIGTKIIPLYEKKRYKTIALDLIAANLNDMATKDVRAVGFCDYIAVHKLDSDAIAEIVLELKNELSLRNCMLLGGETSEMPDLLMPDRIDISGFAIGVGKQIAESVKSGDVIIGLKSSGIHANGFSLIRKLYAEKLLTDDEFEKCLLPTVIYYDIVRGFWQKKLIKAGINITGGGIRGNISRVVKNYELFMQNIPPQDIYIRLKELVKDEIYQVFNCGVGFCVIADEKDKNDILDICHDSFEFGRVL